MEVGIIQSTLAYPSNSSIGGFNGGFAYTNDAYKGRSGTYSSYGATWTANDVIGVALDATGGSITFFKNGVSQGAAYTDLTNYNLPAGYYPAIAIYRNTGLTQSAVFNFGQRPFAYTPPSGFVALNTQNLPEPSIKKPSLYFDATTYTGNGASPQNIVNASGFQPDLVWTKSRNNAGDNFLADAVRGAGNILRSNLADAEVVGTGGITAFNSNGFSVNGNQNTNAYTYVGWQWKESATPGFDIVTYTGDGTTSANRLIDHSLGVKPDFVITKKRSGGTDYGWSCWHKDLGGNYGIWLDKTSARNVSMWSGYSNFSSTKFTPPDLLYGNENGATYVNYLWSEVANFSRFGSYVGNGSSDGPAVWCGFRPRWVLIKSSTVATSWYLFDAVRGTINANSTTLYPNTADIEDTNFGQGLDFLSNGFKVRAPTGYGLNNSSATYIFCAFSETPFKYALAR